MLHRLLKVTVDAPSLETCRAVWGPGYPELLPDIGVGQQEVGTSGSLRSLPNQGASSLKRSLDVQDIPPRKQVVMYPSVPF